MQVKDLTMLKMLVELLWSVEPTVQTLFVCPMVYTQFMDKILMEMAGMAESLLLLVQVGSLLS